MNLDGNRETALIELSWICPNCGAVATGKKEIIGTREPDVKKTRLFTWDDNKKIEKAEEEVLGNKIKKIREEDGKHIFRTAEYDCKCSNCGSVPYWSKFKYSVINNRLGPFCFMATMLLFMLGFEKFTTLIKYSPILRWAFLIPALIYGIWVVYRFLHRNYYEMKLKGLDEKNFPSIKIKSFSSNRKIIHVKAPASSKGHR